MVEFEHNWDKDRVLEGRPSVFEGNLFSVEAFDEITPPSKIDFERASFWVCKFNLPLVCMSKNIGFQIGSSM